MVQSCHPGKFASDLRPLWDIAAMTMIQEDRGRIYESRLKSMRGHLNQKLGRTEEG